MKYQSSFKLKMIKFEKSKNNCTWSRKCDVNDFEFSEWEIERKIKTSLKKMPSNKYPMRRDICYWPELENELYKWITARHQNGCIVSKK